MSEGCEYIGEYEWVLAGEIRPETGAGTQLHRLLCASEVPQWTQSRGWILGLLGEDTSNVVVTAGLICIWEASLFQTAQRMQGAIPLTAFLDSEGSSLLPNSSAVLAPTPPVP